MTSAPRDPQSRRVTLDVAGPIATVTLCRPPMNAIDDAMLAALNDAFAVVEADADVAVLRIRSDQRVFCAGADLRLVGSRVGHQEGASAMVETVRSFHRTFDRLAALPKVTIAEIEGHALGGGLELALACDLRIAAHHAKLGLPEAKVGLLPGAGGTQRLTALCGAGLAARIILSGDLLDGREAERVGLVQWSAHAVDFAEVASGVASRAAGLSADAIAVAKSCIRIADRMSSEGAEAEIGGIGSLMMKPSTERRVADFLSR
ncbi:enoyl-CoA hydratase/isomerase family protein [Pinisolibacter aquiterrae]|uniref:enoyl-CoA hydratase/isomerase family protein n=1 Tax=Pinisolibacter aquiterrae TaxID=2815579 RepID=UPI001C3DA320|nr:enoyl-CoA hydratase/isomerase family protein [Pinisolibacter aquiterrae]MBV5266313.1 enoyl-CoA hydratase/isomerase family protein [Pinisolibacter aquiterrae]MCC8236136.1 enoyl-CoA hydratase/isomerase family protein [Pinisolibacter aquiterrae]